MSDRASGASSTSRSLIRRLQDDEPDAWETLVALYAPLIYAWCRKYQIQEETIADIVQDVFQAVCGKIRDFRKRGPQDTFRGWLRVITRNKVLDHFRRQSRQMGEAAGGTTAQFRLMQWPDPSHPSKPAAEGPSLNAGPEGDGDVSFNPEPAGEGPLFDATPAGEGKPTASPDASDPDQGTAYRDLLRRALNRVQQHFEPRTWQAFWRTVIDDQSPKEVAQELSMSPGAVRVAKSRVLHRLRKELGETTG